MTSPRDRGAIRQGALSHAAMMPIPLCGLLAFSRDKTTSDQRVAPRAGQIEVAEEAEEEERACRAPMRDLAAPRPTQAHSSKDKVIARAASGSHWPVSRACYAVRGGTPCLARRLSNSKNRTRRLLVFFMSTTISTTSSRTPHCRQNTAPVGLSPPHCSQVMSVSDLVGGRRAWVRRLAESCLLIPRLADSKAALPRRSRSLDSPYRPADIPVGPSRDRPQS